jgi:hypothetical protein
MDLDLDPDPDPDPAIFVIDFKTPTFTSPFKDKKSKRSNKTVGIKLFLLFAS